MAKIKNKKAPRSKKGKESLPDSKKEVSDVQKTDAAAEQIKHEDKKADPVQGPGPESLPVNGKDTKQPAKPSAVGKQVKKKKKNQLPGIIFMCNSKTKQDCFKFRVFGLPEAKKDVVEQVTPGTKLFLFDVDLRLLYGVFKASSKGGLNLEAEAFRGLGSYPAQVRFRVIRDFLPLPEKVFRTAIKDNYYGKNKFKFELNTDQVDKLFQLYRSAARDGGVVEPRQQPRAPRSYENDRPLRRRPGLGGELRRPPRVSRSYGNDRPLRRRPELGVSPEDIALARELRARQELPYVNQYNDGSRHFGAADYMPPVHVPAYAVDPLVPEIDPRRFEYGRDAALIPADLYQRENLYSAAYPGQLARTSLAPIPDIAQVAHGVGNSEVELDPLYRQRLMVDGRGYAFDPSVDGTLLRKRPLEEVYVDDRTVLAPKRARIQDDYSFRGVDYNQGLVQAGAYVDDRLARTIPWEQNSLMHAASGITSYDAFTQPQARPYAGGPW